MTADHDEIRALAHAFARKLEHLREFRGVHYVGSASMADPVDSGEPVESVEPISITESPAPTPSDNNRTSQQSTYASEQPDAREPDIRSVADRVTTPATPIPVTAPASAPPSGADRWSAAKKLGYLRERNVGDCQRCPLAKTRSNIVFGVGNPDADLMFVGEAPGGDEDRLGEPFVGAAGQRLDRWIEQLGMRRRDVYIANVLKCRPPGNRDPLPLEIERCSPFLQAQIRAIQPKVLIALGRFAGCLLLDADLKLWEMRDKVHRYREPKTGVEISLIVTYHPSYVLRSEQQPRSAPATRGQPERGGAIKSEDEKVLADLGRAISLVRTRD